MNEGDGSQHVAEYGCTLNGMDMLSLMASQQFLE
jgi:hypothetical protein